MDKAKQTCSCLHQLGQQEKVGQRGTFLPSLITCNFKTCMLVIVFITALFMPVATRFLTDLVPDVSRKSQLLNMLSHNDVNNVLYRSDEKNDFNYRLQHENSSLGKEKSLKRPFDVDDVDISPAPTNGFDLFSKPQTDVIFNQIRNEEATGMKLPAMQHNENNMNEEKIFDQTKNLSAMNIGYRPRKYFEINNTMTKLLLRKLTEQSSINNDKFNWFNENKSRLVFVKLHKVGGTSVASALGRVGIAYSYRVVKAIQSPENCLEKQPFDLSYIHSPVLPWMRTCLPNAQYLILLREPISQYISHLTWGTNRDYFINYPNRRCNYTKPQPDSKPLLAPFKCHDDMVRKNVTKHSLLEQIQSRRKELRKRSLSCYHVCSWFDETQPKSPSDAISVLKNDYSLVGVTEYIDEFLLLVALQKGWSLNSILYHKCKNQGETAFSASELKVGYPKVYERLKNTFKHDNIVYQWAKQRFELLLAQLGPGFDSLLQSYRLRLKQYGQKIFSKRGYNSKRWIHTPNHRGYC